MKQTIVIGATSGSAVALPNGLRLRAVKSAPGIRVTDIRPGLVDTAMAKGEGLFWVMPVGRVVEQVLRAVRRGRRVAVSRAAGGSWHASSDGCPNRCISKYNNRR